MKDPLKLSSEIKEVMILGDLDAFKRHRWPRGKVYGKRGKTILHCAAKYCDEAEIFDYCLKSLKLNPCVFTKRGKIQAIHVSCKYGKLNISKLLCSLPGFCSDTTDIDGESPLSLAVKHNHIEIAMMLIERGADIQHKNKNLWTPLHWACKNGNFVMVNALLQAGANPNALTKFEENALHLSVEGGCINTVGLMLKYIFPLHLSKKGTILHHSYKDPNMLDYVMENTQWKAFPKLPILLEINAPVNIIVKHCVQEFQGMALGLVLRFDRDDLIRDLYFRHVISEEGVAQLSKIGMREKCRKTLNSLSRWQTVKKILFVYKYSSDSNCKLRLPASLIREVISIL